MEPLLRRSGMAGLTVAAGGLLAVVASVSPWWEARAQLALSGAAQDRAVATLVGWQHLAGVATSLAGVIALALGAALAFDRHPGWTRPTALTAGAVIAAGAGVGTWWSPPLGRFPDRDQALTELRAVADDLPVGVELTLSVVRGYGTVLAAVAAAAVVLGVAAARELDQR